MGSFSSKIDPYSVSLFPEIYRGNQRYGSCCGIMAAISFLGIFYLVYLAYLTQYKYENWEWIHLPSFNLQLYESIYDKDVDYEEDKLRTLAYQEEGIIFGASENQLFLKVKAEITQSPANTDTYYNNLLNVNSCVNPDGFCRKEKYGNDVIDSSDAANIKYDIDVKHFSSDLRNIDINTENLINNLDGTNTLSSANSFQNLEQEVTETFSSTDLQIDSNYTQYLGNTIPIFQGSNKITVGRGDIMLISVMIDKTQVQNTPYGFIFELLGVQDFYNKTSGLDIVDAKNWRKIPLIPEDFQDVWVKLGHFHNFPTKYPSGSGYTGAPIFADYTRTFTYDMGTTFINPNYIKREYALHKSDYYDELIEKKYMKNFKQVSNEKIHIHDGFEPQWHKTGANQINTANDKVILAQFYLINTGERQIDIVQPYHLLDFLGYMAAWLILYFSFCSCCCTSLNKYFFNQYFYRQFQARINPN